MKRRSIAEEPHHEIPDSLNELLYKDLFNYYDREIDTLRIPPLSLLFYDYKTFHGFFLFIPNVKHNVSLMGNLESLDNTVSQIVIQKGLLKKGFVSQFIVIIHCRDRGWSHGK